MPSSCGKRRSKDLDLEKNKTNNKMPLPVILAASLDKSDSSQPQNDVTVNGAGVPLIFAIKLCIFFFFVWKMMLLQLFSSSSTILVRIGISNIRHYSGKIMQDPRLQHLFPYYHPENSWMTMENWIRTT